MRRKAGGTAVVVVAEDTLLEEGTAGVGISDQE